MKTDSKNKQQEQAKQKLQIKRQILRQLTPNEMTTVRGGLGIGEGDTVDFTNQK